MILLIRGIQLNKKLRGREITEVIEEAKELIEVTDEVMRKLGLKNEQEKNNQ